MLVELADQRVHSGRVEGRPGQFVQRGHDANVGHLGRVRAAQHLCQRPDVVGADVPGLAGQRHHEREVLGLHPLGEQAQLRVAEQHGRAHPEPDNGRRRGHRTRPLPAPSQAQPDQRAHDRPEQDLLRAQPDRPGRRARRRGHRNRARPGQPAGRPAQRGRQRAARQDPRPQRRDLARPLPGPRHRLRRAQTRRARQRADGRGRPPAVRRQRGPGHRADQPGEPDLLQPLLRHKKNLPSRNKPAGSRVEGSI
ncbi:MAG TPA: hypothetical protein VHS30_23765 [Streptosporangiaceae bacterium]|nr:hypothetical protein [Streptosporangiaceae bacterium]